MAKISQNFKIGDSDRFVALKKWKKICLLHYYPPSVYKLKLQNLKRTEVLGIKIQVFWRENNYKSFSN